MSDGQIVIGTDIDTESFDSEIAYVERQLEEIEDKLKKADMSFEVGDTEKLAAQYEKLVRKLITLRKKQDDLNKTDLSGVQKNIDKIGNGITKTISKVGKWALAVFAIESAYGTVRNAMSTLSQYNQQMASDIEYIQFALASMLQPVIEKMIGLVVKLLQYINYIAQAWFNVNLFANASSKAFNKARNSAKKAQEESKTLASGIDEITNIDTQTKDDETNNITSPSFDLSGIEGKVPEWLQWLANNKEPILAVIAGITAGLLAWKLGLGGLKSLGIGVAIAGIVYTIQSILDYLKNPSWENFGKIITGIGLTIAGVALAFGAWPVAVAGAVVAIIGIVASNWEKIKKAINDGLDWFYGLGDNLMNWAVEKCGWCSMLFNGIIGTIVGVIAGAVENTRNLLESLFTGFKQILDGIIKIVKGDFAGGLKSIAKGIANVIIGIVNRVIGGVNTILSPLRSLIVTAGKITGKNWTMSNIKIPTIPKLAKGGIVNNPGKGVNMGSYIAGERGAEAILPLQNSKFINDFAGSVANQMNSSTIIQLLLDLNRNILEMSNKPIYFKINGKELAQATYQDYQNEEKRQQKSATVVRS
ncbi:MAG: hypothetical protein J6B89_03415 [Bacilli bacterium]|nr:hypothetical protein [Bacilli bacterium]